MSLSQEPADLNKQFPDLAKDFHIPEFFAPDQFFSSVFRISSCGLQLWTHYDVSALLLVSLLMYSGAVVVLISTGASPE